MLFFPLFSLRSEKKHKTYGFAFIFSFFFGVVVVCFVCVLLEPQSFRLPVVSQVRVFAFEFSCKICSERFGSCILCGADENVYGMP